MTLLPLPDHVDHPELEWVHPQLMGEVLHHVLDGGMALRAARGAQVRVARLVRQHRARRDGPGFAAPRVQYYLVAAAAARSGVLPFVHVAGKLCGAV